MSAAILERTIGSADKRIVLNNHLIARTLSIGNSWNKIRLFIRATIGGNANIPANAFEMGVCSGTVAIPGESGGPTHSLGYMFTGQLTLQAAGDPWYFPASGSNLQCLGRVGLTGKLFHNLAMSTSYRVFTADPTRHRMLFGMTIDKTTDSAVECTPHVYTGASVLDYSEAQYLTALESGTLPTGFYNTPGATNSIDEATDGPLDSIFVKWTTALDDIEIADIAVSVVS